MKKRLNRANGVAQNIALGGPTSPLAWINVVRRGSKNRHLETMNALLNPPAPEKPAPRAKAKTELVEVDGEWITRKLP